MLLRINYHQQLTLSKITVIFKCKNKNCIFEVDKKDSYCRLCVNYVRNCVKCNNEFADEITIIDICDNCDNTDIIEYNIDGK